MKKKYLSLAVIPALALVLLGAGQASAHGWFGMGNNATPDEIAQSQQSMFQKEADLLGVSVDDVKNAWAQGKTLQQLAQEKGISQDQLKQKLADARKQQMSDHLKTLVDKGVITQAQADQRLQFMQQQAQNKNNAMSGKGMGMHGGFGMMGL